MWQAGLGQWHQGRWGAGGKWRRDRVPREGVDGDRNPGGCPTQRGGTRHFLGAEEKAEMPTSPRTGEQGVTPADLRRQRVKQPSDWVPSAEPPLHGRAAE